MGEASLKLLGHIAVEAALHAQRREVVRVSVDQSLDWRKVEPVRRLAKARGLELTEMPREGLDELAGGSGHGGVVAEAGPRSFDDLRGLIGQVTDQHTATAHRWLVLLQGVEDPFNLGQCCRALWAAGVGGLVLRQRDWSALEPVLLRSSAGAYDLLPIALTEATEDAAKAAASAGLAVVAADQHPEATSYHEADLASPMLLLIGGEKRGLSRKMLDRADMRVQLPYGRRFDLDLGAVSAASVLGFEAARQRPMPVRQRRRERWAQREQSRGDAADPAAGGR
jgi:23S rRNA (guanosine2251-2'-O)-methyltransferase